VTIRPSKNGPAQLRTLPLSLPSDANIAFECVMRTAVHDTVTDTRHAGLVSCRPTV